MTLWILDTDHVSLFQQGNPNIIRKVQSQSGELAITIITVEEQIRGWLKVIRRDANSEKVVYPYHKLSEVIQYFNTINVLDFNQEAYECYKTLKAKKLQKIGTQDLRIASIALSVNGIVVTRNQRHFQQVPGLQVEDWTLEK